MGEQRGKTDAWNRARLPRRRIRQGKASGRDLKALRRNIQIVFQDPFASLDPRLPIGDAFLELVQPVAREGRFYEQFQQRGEGLFSISVEVEDLDEAVSFLKGKGVKVSEPEASIWPGARLARINHEHTHGVSIQLIERK